MRRAMLLLPLVAACTRPSARPDEIAYWYWHKGLEIGAAQGRVLTEAGVRRIFVRAATLSYDGDRYVATLPQDFGKATPGLFIHLVVNFDAGAIRHFEEVSEEAVSRAVVEAYRSAAVSARSQGWTVAGLQIDFDCPTRLLPRYARMLRHIKAQIGSEFLSATGLTSWLQSTTARDLVSELDLFLPQFYEGRLPKNFADSVPLASLTSLPSHLETLDRLGRPYLVGVPAYGQCLIFDRGDRLVGIQPNLGIDQALASPELRLLGEQKLGTERHYRFRAVAGHFAGYGLLFRICGPETVVEFRRQIREWARQNCRGISIYRVPAEGESMAADLETTMEELRGARPSPDVRARLADTSDPWQAIESGRNQLYMRTLRIRFDNLGAPTAVTPDALRVTLRFPEGSVKEVQAEGFPVRQRLAPGSDRPVEVSLARASGLMLARPSFSRKARADVVVSVVPTAQVLVEWRAKGADGTPISGTLKIEASR